MDKIGPICRSVEDCAIVLNAIYGADGRDDTVVDAPFAWNAAAPIRKLRIGYVEKEFAGRLFASDTKCRSSSLVSRKRLENHSTDDLDEPRSVQRSRRRIPPVDSLLKKVTADACDDGGSTFSVSVFSSQLFTPLQQSQRSHLLRPRRERRRRTLPAQRLDFFEEWRIGAQGREFLEEQREIALLAENG